MFSQAANRWNHIDISVGEKVKIQPGLSGMMVFWQNGQDVYAGSGKTANWDKLTLSEGTDARVEFDNNLVWVKDGDKFYIFGVDSDCWLGIDLATGATMPSSSINSTNNHPSVIKPGTSK